MHASHATVLAAFLLATSSRDAAAQANLGGCNGNPSKVITDNGGLCPGNCFDSPTGQTILTQGAPGSDWVVGISQCIKPFEAISFITWSLAGPGGECTGECGNNKVEGVVPGAPFVGRPIPYGSCTGAPICVYVHDGTFRRGSTGVPLPNVPTSCFSSTNQLCEMCGPYLVTPTLPGGEACIDAFTCTAGDTCDANGECTGTPDSSLCNDNIACTGDVCVADQEPATVGTLPTDVLADGSGCGYKATDVAGASCDDGFSCSGDSCIALPSVAATVGGAPVPDANGCFFDTANGPGCPAVPECAVSQCIAGSPLVGPGTGCLNTEVSNDGVTGFCAAKYGECAAALCVGADGVTGYGEGTVEPDGCSLRPAAEADAACPAPMDCGEGKCNLAPLAAGGGCFINSGPEFDTQCVSDFSCDVGTCEVNTGKCIFTPTNSLCNDGKACTEDICLAGSDPAAQGISAGDVDAVTGCGFKKVDSVCEAKYEACAQPACDPLAASADADGCSVADAGAANMFCTDSLTPDCGVATCSLALLPAGSSGTGIEGTGCSITPETSGCTAGRPCQVATCSNLGECTYNPSNAFCQDPNNGFAPPGGFGACATASCAPDTSADATGCVATPVTPNPCDLAPGACGTSECNVATGACDVTSAEQAGQCPECADCVNNQCVGGCVACQKCEADTCVADEGASCSINGGNCFCNAAGVCDTCISECPSCAPELGFRGCAEEVGRAGQATCGAPTCNLLCRLKCGDQRNYDPQLCNGAGGCSCQAQRSVLEPELFFNGPCCRCTAECLP